MIDAHMHVWDQVLLPELLFEGVTTVRDMGTQITWMGREKTWDETIPREFH